MNVLKRVADSIPEVTEKLPAIATFATGTISAAHPVLTSLSYQALEYAAVAACMSMMNEFRITSALIVVGAETGAIIGAIIGAYVGWKSDSPTPQPLTDNERDKSKKSFLQSQSIFNQKSCHGERELPGHKHKRSRSI